MTEQRACATERELLTERLMEGYDRLNPVNKKIFAAVVTALANKHPDPERLHDEALELSRRYLAGEDLSIDEIEALQCVEAKGGAQ